MRICFLLLSLLLSLSCARQVPSAHMPKVPPHPVRQAMERHVANAVDAGDGDLEVQALRRAVLEHPKDVNARTDLASRYLKMGFPELAAEHYRLAAGYAEDPEVYVTVARGLRAAGMATEAVRLLDKFLAGTPDSPPAARAWSGILHDEVGELAVGESEHRRAIADSTAPRDYLYNNLGYNLLLQGRSNEAEAEFRRALELSPRSEISRNNLGLALGSSDEAVQHWQSVSGPAAAHNNMAAVHIEQGRYPEARRELNLSLGYDPGNDAALHNLALVSQLDGLPAVLPLNRSVSRWKKFGMIFGGRRNSNPVASPLLASRQD